MHPLSAFRAPALWVVLLLAACQSPPPAPDRSISSNDGYLGSPHQIRAALYDQYREWQGVPYRMGGITRQGIDCSGFVQQTFRQQFGVELPRDTESQSRLGIPVPARGLQAGDLVFFNTGWNRHVGIYVKDQTFLHASSSKGVSLSRLDNPYWQRNYWQSRRLEE